MPMYASSLEKKKNDYRFLKNSFYGFYNALINVKRDPSPMGRVTGLGGDSIDFRLPGKGVFERTRGTAHAHAQSSQ